MIWLVKILDNWRIIKQWPKLYIKSFSSTSKLNKINRSWGFLNVLRFASYRILNQNWHFGWILNTYLLNYTWMCFINRFLTNNKVNNTAKVVIVIFMINFISFWDNIVKVNCLKNSKLFKYSLKDKYFQTKKAKIRMLIYVCSVKGWKLEYVYFIT